jgi:glycerophosphoryl diester phosphodiesterase
MKKPTSVLTAHLAAALILAALSLGSIASAQELILPGPQAGPLDAQVPTDTGGYIHLRLETQYPTQDFGSQLSTYQMDKLDAIRAQAPDKFQLLSALYPEQITEYLLRSPQSAPSIAASDDSTQSLLWQIATEYLTEPQSAGFTDAQLRARADFIRASLASLPPQPPAIQRLLDQACQVQDPDFDSPAKASTFAGLDQWYSPYRPISMSIVGDVLRIDDRVVTYHLSDAAVAAGQDPEQYAHACYSRYNQAIARWRAAQVTGNAYAGSIRSFLDDPRLAGFTPDEVSKAYQRVFGRDLKTDLEADQISARLGHPITYNDLHSQSQKE